MGNLHWDENYDELEKYMPKPGLNFEVGTPAGHTDPMTFEDAMALLEQAPHASLDVWVNGEWQTIFDGQDEFLGVQPE